MLRNIIQAHKAAINSQCHFCKCELSSTDQYKVSNYTDEINMIYKDDGADVWLECGLPRQKGMLVCIGYRQWRLLGQQDSNSASVSEQLERWTVFLDNWETALNEEKEVIVMLDANLDFLTWRNSDELPPHHSSNRLKSFIDTLFDRIMPLGVSQLVTGATRMERGQPQAGLDHIYTNKPEKL